MYDLPKFIPDPDVLLALEPEELAAKMLFLLEFGNSAGRKLAADYRDSGGEPSPRNDPME